MVRHKLLHIEIVALALGALATPARAADATVSIDNFTFTPQRLVVDRGTRVTWVNHDDIPHTVFNRDHPSQQHSPPLDTDDSYSIVFDTPGSYGYFCSLHPHMQGEIVVR